MSVLTIRHIGNSEPARFHVARKVDDKSTKDPATVVSPIGFPVEGRPDSELMRELVWYLEKFLGYPYHPETEHAERVQAALRAWGEQAFRALFGDAIGGGFYNDATREGPTKLDLRIVSDDPRILGWPWEALRKPGGNFLAHTGQIERRLNNVDDPYEPSKKLPKDRINILLVTARPYKEDVAYRSLSRPLVELVDRKKLPATVTILRPPTFQRLREHLREKPDFYHIVHFDGHGAYQAESVGPVGSHLLKGPIGRLVFETDDGQADPKDAEQLSALLREFKIPAVVLNACQSAMVDGEAADPFASVAASLVQSGVRSVVAMAYSLYVSGAQQFLPAFYERLFETGDFAQATRAGRQQMFAEKGRVCARGLFDLEDWLVPVAYQQDPIEFKFGGKPKAPRAKKTTEARPLPPEVADSENPYGFVGRDSALLELERAMRRAPAGILIRGLGGVGKTTLARGFVQWLHATDGLGQGCFWSSFQEIRSAEHVINRLGEKFFGTNFGSAPMPDRIEALAQALRDNPFVLVWDNFEVVHGIAGTSVEALLSGEDRDLLKTLLRKLRGGKTKVLITSRAAEEWLGDANLNEILLGGLDDEERWEYCEAILKDWGFTVDQNDPELSNLMDLLGGHPLSMRVILTKLKGRKAADLAKILQSNLAELGPGGDEAQAKLFATLRFVEQTLPDDLRPLLVPLALHEQFVDVDYLEYMAKRVDAGWTRDRIDRFAQSLAAAGLLRDRGNGLFEIHPALTGFLRSPRPSAPPADVADAWSHAFVDVMAALADRLTPKPLHEQRIPFHLWGASFNHALAEGERLQLGDDLAALVQSLAAYAQNDRNFGLAERLFLRLAESPIDGEQDQRSAGAYHQLGRVAQERRDLDAAERWYLKSLAIEERQGNEHGAARTYHQLGSVAQERRDLDAAERWYLKSLEISERLGIEHYAASTYHQLGMVAQERRDLDAAERWYLKSLAIEERQGNEHGAARTYHQLGIVAEERRDLDAAERWYLKSLEISERQGNEHGAAITYHQLGRVAEERRDLDAAERWYLKSLEISERLSIEHYATSTYHQLGMVAEERRDFDAAERWYLKSLEISERLSIEHYATSTYHQLGMVAEERRDFDAAERWYLKSLEIEERQGNEHGAAGTYGQLGIVARLRGHHEDSGRWLIRCIQAFERTRDPAGVERNRRNYLVTFEQAPPSDQDKLRVLWEAAGLGPFPEPTGPGPSSEPGGLAT